MILVHCILMIVEHATLAHLPRGSLILRGGAATILSCVTLRILLGNLIPATYGFYLCNPLACHHAVDMLRTPL